MQVISALASALVITRLFKAPEYVWAVSGVGLLLTLRLLTPAGGLAGVAKGLDMYPFLTGMVLLAAHATRLTKGSTQRLFLLIYPEGVLVTTFLANDATAVVLTPAVAGAVRACGR